MTRLFAFWMGICYSVEWVISDRDFVRFPAVQVCRGVGTPSLPNDESLTMTLPEIWIQEAAMATSDLDR